jgi:hypothetical protein
VWLGAWCACLGLRASVVTPVLRGDGLAHPSPCELRLRQLHLPRSVQRRGMHDVCWCSLFGRPRRRCGRSADADVATPKRPSQNCVGPRESVRAQRASPYGEMLQIRVYHVPPLALPPSRLAGVSTHVSSAWQMRVG